MSRQRAAQSACSVLTRRSTIQAVDCLAPFYCSTIPTVDSVEVPEQDRPFPAERPNLCLRQGPERCDSVIQYTLACGVWTSARAVRKREPVLTGLGAECLDLRVCATCATTHCCDRCCLVGFDPSGAVRRFNMPSWPPPNSVRQSISIRDSDAPHGPATLPRCATRLWNLEHSSPSCLLPPQTLLLV